MTGWLVVGALVAAALVCGVIAWLVCGVIAWRDLAPEPGRHRLLEGVPVLERGSMILAEERAYRGGWESGSCASTDALRVAELGTSHPPVTGETFAEHLEHCEQCTAELRGLSEQPWLDAMHEQLAPDALDRPPVYVDDFGFDASEHLDGWLDEPQDVPRPETDTGSRAEPERGPGHPETSRPGHDALGSVTAPPVTGPGDFLASMDDADFWNMARFELRRLVFEAGEPFKLSPWRLVPA